MAARTDQGVLEVPARTTVVELCEALDRMIGTSGPEVQALALRSDFARFAAALGAEGELATVNGRAVAPVMFVCSIQDWHSPPVVDGLRPDGTGADRTSFLPLEGFRLTGGGQDIEFHAPVLEGMRLRVRATLEGVALKRGRSGDLAVLSVNTVYADETGNALVTSLDTLLAR